MKKTLLLAAAASALGAAVPAAAQYYQQPQRYAQPYGYQTYTYPGQYGADTAFDARIGQLRARLDAGIQAGTIDPREAYRLRREMDDLQRVQARYSYNGLSTNERADLQRRIRAVRQDMRYADNGAWDRYERYGYDDRSYYGPSAGAGYYGQGGPYEEVVCENRGGVAGVIDTFLGTNNCYRIGDRISTSGLYGVPSQYRGMYRDNGSIYYRSDGRAVYGIDARTNTIVSINPLR
jgi:hypothetical protein